jgi:hypothetical protein
MKKISYQDKDFNHIHLHFKLCKIYMLWQTIKNKLIGNEIQSTWQCLTLRRKRQISPQYTTAEAFCTIQKYSVTAIITIDTLEAASASLSSDWRRQTFWKQERAYKQLQKGEKGTWT